MSLESASRACSGVRPVDFATVLAEFANMSVSVHPGQTALTVTFLCAHSSARARVRPSRACFEAQYAEVYLNPLRAAVEATLTMRPPPRSAILGKSARHSTNGA